MVYSETSPWIRLDAVTAMYPVGIVSSTRVCVNCANVNRETNRDRQKVYPVIVPVSGIIGAYGGVFIMIFAEEKA